MAEESEERLDEAEAIECLNKALAQQYRSALQYSIVAASLKGLEAQSLGAKLTEFGDEELSGARQLIEKIVSFGGEPTTEVSPLRFDAGTADAIAWLVSCEIEVVDSLLDARDLVELASQERV